VLFTALLGDARPMLAGAWAVAIMSHVSLFQRIVFAWKRYRFVDPMAFDPRERTVEVADRTPAAAAAETELEEVAGGV
jgi:hypothetical protein